MTKLKMHLFDAARASPVREPAVFRLLSPPAAPLAANTAPRDYFIPHRSQARAHYHDTRNPDISEHCVTFHFSLR